MKHRLEKKITDFTDFRKEVELWKIESRKYLDGLSKAIEQQLAKWKLTAAEKKAQNALLK